MYNIGDFNIKMNGRVDAAQGAPAPFALFAQSEEHRGRDNMKSTLRTQASPLSDLFFSGQNVEALQQGIRYRVFKESGDQLVIERQSEVELGVIMRSVFLTEARNDARPPREQVRELNAAVLAYSVPRVLEEARMYAQYRRDASTLPVPIDRGELATSKGTRTLEMKPFF